MYTVFTIWAWNYNAGKLHADGNHNTGALIKSMHLKILKSSISTHRCFPISYYSHQQTALFCSSITTNFPQRLTNFCYKYKQESR